MKKYLTISFIISCFIFLFFAGISHAALAGKVTVLQGRVDVLKPGKNVTAPVKAGDIVDVGDIYRAKSDGRAEITFLNGNVLKIAPNSRAEIQEAMFEGDRNISVIKLYRGRVQASSSPEFVKKVAAFAEGNKFEVHTPNAVAGIRGSTMIVSFIQGTTGTLFVNGTGYQFNPNDPQRRIVVIVGGTISFVSTVTGSATPPRAATPGEMAILSNAIASVGPSGGVTTLAGSGTTVIVDPGPSSGSTGSSSNIITNSPPNNNVTTPPPTLPTTTTTTSFKSTFSPALSFYSTPSQESVRYNAALFGTVASPISLQLTWGASPSDLDSHAWVPGPNSYYQVYYANRGTLSSAPYTRLDQDITSGYGPETITINQFSNGTTNYSVYNYTGNPSITASSATVVVRDASNNIIATYTIPATGSGRWWNLLSLNATSTSTGSLYIINSIEPNDTTATISWQRSGSITNATMEGSGNLWTSGTLVPTTVTGQYTASGGQPRITSTELYSQNNDNTNKTTSDGGAYYGVLSASELNNNITARHIGVYIDPSGNTGYTKGSFSGTVDPAVNTFAMNGNIFSTNIPIPSGTGVQPADLYNNIDVFYWLPGNLISGSGSFAAGGTISNITARDDLYYLRIVNQDWGIWNSEIGSTYSGATTTGNNSDWTASITADNSPYTINRFEITGAGWSDQTITGTIYGYGGDVGSGKTWINVGEVNGSFNPSALTSQAILTGMWIETNKFLELASTETGKTSLQRLDIPCVEVGRANLSGSGNNLTVAMNNVIFFSTPNSAAPQIWATGSATPGGGVSGTYTANPSIGVPVNLSGSGLSAQFNVQQWDTGANKWLSTITGGGGTLSGGSYSGNITFKGVGAGTITPGISTGTGTFSGTAAGTARGVAVN